VLTDEERRIFLQEGRAAIQRNRNNAFMCSEPAYAQNK